MSGVGESPTPFFIMPKTNNSNTGVQLTDTFGAENNMGLFDDGSGYGINSASEMSNSGIDEVLDPTGLVKGFYNDIMGFTSQEREHEQQMEMTKYQNEWNSAQAQMERAKKAGINPLTAAAGISGGGTGAVAPSGGSASPSSAAGDVIGNLGRMPSDVASSDAKAGLDAVTARLAPDLADAEIVNKAAAAAKDLTSAGIPEISAIPLAIKYARSGLSGFAQAFNADNECRMFDFEMNKIEADINTENARFADLTQQARLHGSLADLTDVQTDHEKILRDLDGKKLELTKKYKAMAADSEFMQQFLIAEQFGYNSPEYNKLMSFYKDKFYNSAIGEFNADMDTAFGRKLNEAKAQLEANAEYKPYLDGLDVIKSAYQDFFSALFQNPTSIKSAIGKLLGSINNAVAIMGIKAPYSFSSKPSKGAPKHSIQRSRWSN